MTVIISVLIATLVAQPLLGSFESIFQYIQNFTGYFSPGIVVIFCSGKIDRFKDLILRKMSPSEAAKLLSSITQQNKRDLYKWLTKKS